MLSFLTANNWSCMKIMFSVESNFPETFFQMSYRTFNRIALVMKKNKCENIKRCMRLVCAEIADSSTKTLNSFILSPHKKWRGASPPLWWTRNSRSAQSTTCVALILYVNFSRIFLKCQCY